MRSDLLEDFELLKKKANSEQLSVLLFKFNAYIEAYCVASDQLKYAKERLEKEAKEMSVLRDLLKEMKEKINANP